MGLFDKLFNPKTDYQPSTAGANLYHGLAPDFVKYIFEIENKMKGSEIEAILFFSQLVRFSIVASYPNTHQKVLSDFTDAAIKDLLVKNIENCVSNPTDFINSRAEFYSMQWVEYNEAVITYYKSGMPERTERAFIDYLREHYPFTYVRNLIYHTPLQQFKDLKDFEFGIRVSTDKTDIKEIAMYLTLRELRFLRLVAHTSDAVQNWLDALHNKGVL